MVTHVSAFRLKASLEAGVTISSSHQAGHSLSAACTAVVLTSIFIFVCTHNTPEAGSMLQHAYIPLAVGTLKA